MSMLLSRLGRLQRGVKKKTKTVGMLVVDFSDCDLLEITIISRWSTELTITHRGKEFFNQIYCWFPLASHTLLSNSRAHNRHMQVLLLSHKCIDLQFFNKSFLDTRVWSAYFEMGMLILFWTHFLQFYFNIFILFFKSVFNLGGDSG